MRALIVQAVFSVRSERQLCEQLEYNLLFRWFVGLDLDEPAWDPTSFTKNRARLIESEFGQAFLSETVRLAQSRGLTSDERFVVDGTLIKAYASMKSFKSSDDDSDNFKGTKRSNATHRSRTDADARLMRKGFGRESMLCYGAHILMDSLNGLIRGAKVKVIGQMGEVDAALEMVGELSGSRLIRVAADKGYDCGKFVRGMRRLRAQGHPVPKREAPSVDGRTTRHRSFAQSMRDRPKVEKIFGWVKAEGRLRQTRFRGSPKVALAFELTAGTYNILRMAKLSA